jgi:hypothetical protein
LDFRARPRNKAYLATLCLATTNNCTLEWRMTMKSSHERSKSYARNSGENFFRFREFYDRVENRMKALVGILLRKDKDSSYLKWAR